MQTDEICSKRNKKEPNDKKRKVKNSEKKTTEGRKVQMTVEEKFKTLPRKKVR